jgi:hypothetical protein
MANALLNPGSIPVNAAGEIVATAGSSDTNIVGYLDERYVPVSPITGGMVFAGLGDTTQAFANSQDFTLTTIPTFDAGITTIVDNYVLQRTANSIGASRYGFKETVRLASTPSNTNYDSSGAITKLATIKIPAGAISNGETINLNVKLSCPQTFGSNGVVYLQFAGGNQMRRVTTSSASATSISADLVLTADGVGRLVVDPLVSEFAFDVGGNARSVNLLQTIEITVFHQFTTADSAGRSITGSLLGLIRPTIPSAVVGATYVDPRDRPFSRDSIWNTPLSATAVLQSATDPETVSFRSTANGQTFWGGLSVNLFQQGPNDPYGTLTYASRAFSNRDWFFKNTANPGTVSLRLPAGIVAAPVGDDRNVGLFTQNNRYYIDMWKYDHTANTNLYSATSFTVHDLYGKGWPEIWNDVTMGSNGVNTGVRAAGGPLIGGLVRKFDIDSGVIAHAVMMTISLQKQRKLAAFSVSQNAATLPTVSAGGTGYKIGEVLTENGGTGVGRRAEFTVTSINITNGAVTGVWPTNTGKYTTSPGTALTVSGGSGTGCTLTATILANDRQGCRVFPATNVDGNFAGYNGEVPMGSLWTIPRNVDVNSLGLSTPEALMFAKAIQDYGAYNMDAGDNVTSAIFTCANDVPYDVQVKITGRTNGVMVNMNKIGAAMVMVKNNTPQHVGGYGPRATPTTDGPFPLF